MERIRSLFKGIYEGIGKFGKIINTIVTFVLLFLVFVFGIGLVSLFSKLSSKKFLDMKPDSSLPSYWQESIIAKRNKEDYYKPF